MMKSHRGKSAARRPLGDISNARNHLRSRNKGGTRDDGALDGLLALRSDLSNLIGQARRVETLGFNKWFNSLQIDKLVAQAVENKTISKRASHDVDSFSKILSDMHLSLKPWFSRLQQLLETTDPAAPENKICKSSVANSVSDVVKDGDADANAKNESEVELIISPWPLVCWRPGTCTIESGRQLFLLTPLPNSKSCLSRCPRSSKSMLRILTEEDKSHCSQLPASSVTANSAQYDLLGKIEEKQAATDVSKHFAFQQTSNALDFSPLTLSNHKNKKIDRPLSTPFIPKSTAIVDPIFELCQEGYGQTSESAEDNNEAEFSNDFNAEISDGLITNYEELLGLQPAPTKNRRKGVDEPLNWFLSPPKTCTLLEPSDEKPLPTPNARLSIATAWDDFESTQKGKLPGEATLKRELWTKFEAVSSNQLHFDVSIFQKTGGKGFLDMLEEVSESTDLDFKVSR